VEQKEENNMNQLLVFVRKEFYHAFRDTKTLLMLFGLPIVEILLFGFALTNEIKNTKIAIFDNSKDEVSQKIIEKIEANAYFDIQRNITSSAEIEKAFKSNKIKAAIIFPSNFQKELMHSNTVQMQIIADASDPNTATMISNYLQAIVLDYQKSQSNGVILPLQISVETRMLYNPELLGAPNFVPGVMALILLLVCVLMTSVAIVREKELGTMELLLVSPLHPFLVLVAKTIPYLVVSIINFIIILLLSVFLLDMPIHGSIVLLFFESVLFIITALSLGLLISNVTSNQAIAMLISVIGMMLPTMLFTGFMFPIENMPIPLQVISHIVPSRWYFIIVKSIMIKGLGFSYIWKETLILVAMTSVLLFVSLKKFKTRLQ
jgi:ABC-2 type transport system permease protein